MKASLRLATISLVALLVGCAHPKVAQIAPVTSPPAAPKVLGQAAPTPTFSPADRLQLAVTLLEKGDSANADVELKQVLAQTPDNKEAQYLVQQIEMPVSALFPKDNFSVKLDRDGSLSALAQTYLGNQLAFFGLARYNAIAVPAKVGVGQTIHIPKTAMSLAAKAQATEKAEPPARAASLLVHTDADAQAAQKMANRYYKDGLVALQHQDLDGAIAAWDKVLAIDPNYKDVQLNRAQALQLKENLKKLGG
jgi:Tfp pilus assembly protein PilF